MSETPLSPDAGRALAALRRWTADGPRARLVAACWRAGERNISELARAAGKPRKTIYEDLRREGIDVSIDREENPDVTVIRYGDQSIEPGVGTWEEVPPAGWRHPNIVKTERRPKDVMCQESLADGIRPADHYVYRITFTPFTGTEPRPDLPDEVRAGFRKQADVAWGSPEENTVDWCGYHQRHAEIALLIAPWADTRLERALRAIIEPSKLRQWGAGGVPTDLWKTFVAAHQALKDAYEAMKTCPDGQWNTGLGRIVDVTGPAKHAASGWDTIAWQIAKVVREYEVETREDRRHHDPVKWVAEKVGISTDGWLIPDYHEDMEHQSWRYDGGGGTAEAAVAATIRAGQEWLEQVQHLSQLGRR